MSRSLSPFSARTFGALSAGLVLLLAASQRSFPAAAGTPTPAPARDLSRNETTPAVVRRLPESVADLKAMEKHVEELTARVSPVVVAVQVGGGQGSGVVVSAEGLVLSAAHVCQKPGLPVRFTFPNGRVVRGQTLGTNHELDCGLMQITDRGPWPFVEMGNRTSIQAGDWVLALGHPGGFEAERPVVARLGRVIRTGMLLQTDCTLIGGDSGGPLFDMSGRVIGIHSRISESTAENFHIPIASYSENWVRLERGDNWGLEAIRAPVTIGVRSTDGPSGCQIERVREGGPADQAGLKAGDIVMRVEGETIEDSAGFTRCIRQAGPGDVLIMRIRRDRTELSVRVKAEALRGRGPWRGRP